MDRAAILPKRQAYSLTRPSFDLTAGRRRKYPLGQAKSGRPWNFKSPTAQDAVSMRKQPSLD
jgi:hypothetical protein